MQRGSAVGPSTIRTTRARAIWGMQRLLQTATPVLLLVGAAATRCTGQRSHRWTDAGRRGVSGWRSVRRWAPLGGSRPRSRHENGRAAVRFSECGRAVHGVPPGSRAGHGFPLTHAWTRVAGCADRQAGAFMSLTAGSAPGCGHSSAWASPRTIPGRRGPVDPLGHGRWVPGLLGCGCATGSSLRPRLRTSRRGLCRGARLRWRDG
jgi:hypothetical protein